MSGETPSRQGRAVDEDRSASDRKLDETLEETFPASDAPANTVETGIRVGPVPQSPIATDNRAAGRFELVVDGLTAFLTYERTPRSLVLVHTEVPSALRGRHLADALARAAIDAADAEGLRFVAVCPFVKAFLRKHSHHDTPSETDRP
jgi:predicted GNAT family acetyltransferase